MPLLSRDRAVRRARAINVISNFPEFLQLLENRVTHVTHLAAIAQKVTNANKAKILQFLPNKSKRKLDLFLSTLNRDGSVSDVTPTISLNMKLTEGTFELYERARDLISKDWRGVDHEDVMKRLLNDFLDVKDPQRKAERMARKRAGEINASNSRKTTETIDKGEEEAILPVEIENRGKSQKEEIPVCTSKPSSTGATKKYRYISREIDRALRLRDGGRCTYTFRGKRCERTADLEIDHIIMHCLGGSNEISNLRLRCPSHNRLSASLALGRKYRPSLN